MRSVLLECILTWSQTVQSAMIMQRKPPAKPTLQNLLLGCTSSLLTHFAIATHSKTASRPALHNLLLDCFSPSLTSNLHLQVRQVLGIPVHCLASHYDDAERCSLSFSFQVREAALFGVQEQQRVLAADAAPHQGSYQPLLAAAPPAVGSKARFRWPDHHAADLRHIVRSAFRSSPSCGSWAC